MNATLKPGIIYYLLLIAFSVSLLLFVLALFFSESLIVKIPLVIVVFYLGRRAYAHHFVFPKLRMEIRDNRLVIPAIPAHTYWPVDLQGNLVTMPGFEFYGNVRTKPPFFDGEDRFVIPFKNLTGIWITTGSQNVRVLTIGTDFFDVKFRVRLFGWKRLQAFLPQHIPQEILEASAEKSVFYQNYLQNMHQILEQWPEETTHLIKKRDWNPLIVGAVIYAVVWIMNLGSNSVELLCWASLMPAAVFASAYAILQFRRSQVMTVDEEWIRIGHPKKQFGIRWADIQYVFISPDSYVLWNTTQRLMIPKEYVKRNKLFSHIFGKYQINGSIKGKWGIFQVYGGQKNTRIRPEIWPTPKPKKPEDPPNDAGINPES